MLNHPDYFITAVVFPYGSEDPWAVKVSFKNRKNGKLSEGYFGEQEGYFSVQQQTVRQIATREYVKVSHEPKPKRQAPVKAPIVGKGKGKGKKG